jgi:hypothetical protein
MNRRDVLTLAVASMAAGVPTKLAGRLHTTEGINRGGVMGDEQDFDFLYRNDWKVENTVLKRRLVGSDEWDTFDAVLEDVQPILNGSGNVDRFSGVRGGRE